MMNTFIRKINKSSISNFFNFQVKSFSHINIFNNNFLFGPKKNIENATGGGVKVQNLSSKSKISVDQTIKKSNKQIVETPKEITKTKTIGKQTLNASPIKKIIKKEEVPVTKVPAKNVNKSKKIEKEEEVKRPKSAPKSNDKYVEKVVDKKMSISNKKEAESVPTKRITQKSNKDVSPVEVKKKGTKDKLESLKTNKEEKTATKVLKNLESSVSKNKESVKIDKTKENNKINVKEVKPKSIKLKTTNNTHRITETVNDISIQDSKLEETKDETDSLKSLKKGFKKDYRRNYKLGSLDSDTPLSTEKYTSNLKGLYEDYIDKISSLTTKSYIYKEREFLCNNYAPLPVVLKKGDGIYVQDVDGKWYMDFLSAYSALNHGHLNKRLIDMANRQMNLLYMTSRAFYNNILGEAAEIVCRFFNYDKVLFMNSGVEAGESAVKLARRWGYDVKGIPDNQAKVVFAKNNFWGRTIYACGTSDDPVRYSRFGPYDTNSSYLVEYDNVEELEILLKNDSNICAVFLEPIQGEGGIIIPNKDYFYHVKRLCEKYKCLMIDDEIQTGLGRAGFLLYTDYMGVKPDIVLLGKSLSGGMYPVSAVLASSKIMDLIKPGEHGSTYGGNPLAAQITIASIAEINNLSLIINSFKMGIEFGVALKELENNKFIKEIRGRGLMFGLELYDDCPFNAYDVSIWLMERGLLSKSTKTYILRLTPPLIINSEEIHSAADIIIKVFKMAEALYPNYESKGKVKYNLIEADSNELTRIQNLRNSKNKKSEDYLSSLDQILINMTPIQSNINSIDDLNVENVIENVLNENKPKTQ